MTNTIITRRKTVKIDKRHVSHRQEAKRLRTLAIKNKKRDTTRQRRFDRGSKLAVRHENPSDDGDIDEYDFSWCLDDDHDPDLGRAFREYLGALQAAASLYVPNDISVDDL
ncbi:MAG: hypothetical protein Faunusvirus6_16 [Faunusvirus sp.]|uniref:Uncharacterized protein n=1 Tax=Faunusvirus sp. TaxID=2487766 RepID=A0A3G4ZWE9_9VIRU|nr:MAG: hypothetical protein Faunusvirus6_16 [Faunusvirus sp.]